MKCAHCGQERGESTIAHFRDLGFDPLEHCLFTMIHEERIEPCVGRSPKIGRQCELCPRSKKYGRWERVEIFAAAGQYRLSVGGFIDYCPRVPGFGGIDYQSPFDPKVIVRSMVPVMFRERSTTAFVICEQAESCRPGIPVAAWFWKEGEK